jgi:hypothetical protein
MIYSAFLLGGAVLGLFARWLNRRRRRSARRVRRVAWASSSAIAILLTLLCLSAGGYMFWYSHRPRPPSERRALFRGIDYVRDVRNSPRPMIVHVATIDLAAPGVHFLVTPGERTDGRDIRARKTSKFVERFGVQLAINGNYFYPFRSESPLDYFPHDGDGVDLCGVAASRGDVYSKKKWVEGTLYISADNRASFDAPVGAVYNAIAGNGFVVRGGAPVASAERDEPYPRAGLGLSADRRRMTFFIIDGKQPGYSEGATLAELSRVMIEFGVHDGVRLDEGGSCALAIEERPGRARLLNVPINNRIPYRERVVGNHLGVFAGRLAE